MYKREAGGHALLCPPYVTTLICRRKDIREDNHSLRLF